MHAKNGRLNSDFQIEFFLAGDCSTYDGAYAVLKEQERSRREALAFAFAQVKQSQARIMLARWGKFLLGWLPPARLWLEGYLEVFEAHAEMTTLVFEAAQDEVATLQRLIRLVSPLRELKHLSDREAFQACERAEWRGELMRRAEDQLATQGFIKHDDFRAMRNHPDFTKIIGPHIEAIRARKAAELLPTPVQKYLLAFEEADV